MNGEVKINRICSYFDKHYKSSKKLTANSQMVFAVQVLEEVALVVLDINKKRSIVYDPTDRDLSLFNEQKARL